MQVEASSSMHKSRWNVSGRRRENDVENTGIDHSDDGKVNTDRSLRLQFEIIR